MKSSKFYEEFGLVEFNDKRSEMVADKIAEVAKSGKFYSVVFVKKDGTVREMVARQGVKKYLKGGEKTLPSKYICCFEPSTGSYKAINPSTVMKINGQTV